MERFGKKIVERYILDVWQGSEYDFAKYFKFQVFCTILVCVCMCVCVFILFHRKGFFLLQRCLWHNWGIRINDLVSWVLVWVLLPNSFISVSKNVIFHLQRQKSSTLTIWRDMLAICEKKIYIDIRYKPTTH